MSPMMDDNNDEARLVAATLKRAYQDDLPSELPDQFADLLDALRAQDKAKARKERQN